MKMKKMRKIFKKCCCVNGGKVDDDDDENLEHAWEEMNKNTMLEVRAMLLKGFTA